MLDGPSPDIQALTGLSVAKDGSGGLAYVKDVAGVRHVFVSPLQFGSFAPPVQIDSQLQGASSQPVIGAGPGGLLLIAFINSGQLYVVGSTTEPAQFSAPQPLFSGALNPAISVTPLGKAYIAFTATSGSTDQVRTAYYFNGRWGVAVPALNANPAESAGIVTGAPAVAASGDGEAIVTWGEAGHVYLRRVWGLGPSTAVYQADVPSLGSWNELSADQPAVATGGDSSYVDVGFRETFANGSQQQSRVLLRRLRASVWDPVNAPDGLATPGTSSADAPQISMADDGIGLVTTARSDTNQLWGATLGSQGQFGAVQQIDSQPNFGPPYASPVDSGFKSGLIAWQEDPGALGARDIRARFYDGNSFSPEQVISPANIGPADAADGLFTGADFNVDVAVAWVQGAVGQRQIVVDQLYQPPGGFSVTPKFRYVRSVLPTLRWNPAHELWGPQYLLTVDGALLSRTFATQARVPSALSQGPHAWSVEAANGGGLTSTAKPAIVFVDTVPPTVHYTLSGKLRIGTELHVYVNYTDAPPGLPASDGSGVKLVTVNWGDGSKVTIKHGKYHAYTRAGRYRLTITVTDNAGNTTRQTQTLKITPRPKPHKHKKKRK